ncbi:tyrosine-protein phosphatase [Microbacterium sp. M3]|uniref:Tyrosine-protein phosphatase n=2 Tax=Microbacteriaceae TaxID=85023 RepID=A0ABU4H3M7_9MICO|nr:MULTISPECIES: tyrosine-protein phosphatase [Microbacterium]MDW4573275.1 tyrosine-protein phosphatase [Microbacterium arthrosphaerae]MDW7607130.1 tyrosine-protein phosphatase [Microbacterium sp. M3]
MTERPGAPAWASSDPERPADPVVPGAMNLRDVGGLRAGSAATRYRVLFRSGNLARLDEQGTRALADLRLRRIIDLRADDEVQREPSRIAGLDVVTQRVPLFLGSVESFFRDDLSLDEMYRQLVDDSAEGVVAVVRGILADQPVLVHCTVGKDRTGVTIALTLAAAGVDADAVIGDYARTEGLLPPRRNRRIVEVLRSMHPDAVHLEDLATRSPAPVMRALLDDVARRYGSADGYLRAHGLADDEIAELRRVLVQRES